jgi:tetratricopeptide (TPR) repeat protein
MRKQALVLGALLVLGGVARAIPLPDDALVDQGSKRLQAGDADGALNAFAQAHKRAPRDPRPHYLSAVALQKKGDAPGAERELKAALTLDPKLAEVRNELGAMYNEQRRFGDAETELRRAVADKPDLGEAWFNLGQAALMRKDCPTALDAYARATRLAPQDPDGFINESVAARRCGKLPVATQAARQAVKQAARSAPAHLNLGITLEAAGKLDDAASEYVVATRLKPDYATAWWSLGLIERKRKRTDAAIAALERAQAISPTPARIADLGVAWRDKGNLAKATALFRRALAKDPRYTPARWHLAQTLAAAHQCAELRKELGLLPAADAHSEAAQKLRSACK